LSDSSTEQKGMWNKSNKITFAPHSFFSNPTSSTTSSSTSSSSSSSSSTSYSQPNEYENQNVEGYEDYQGYQGYESYDNNYMNYAEPSAPPSYLNYPQQQQQSTLTPLVQPQFAFPLPYSDGSSSSTSSSSSSGKQKKNRIVNNTKRYYRVAAGESWEDPTLATWDDNDYRIFVGDLGNEVNDDMLKNAFQKYKSYQKSRVLRDKKTLKTRGFGFVSFSDPMDFAKAMREMNGKYIGNRPVKLFKSKWQDRGDIDRTQFKPAIKKSNNKKVNKRIIRPYN